MRGRASSRNALAWPAPHDTHDVQAKAGAHQTRMHPQGQRGVLLIEQFIGQFGAQSAGPIQPRSPLRAAGAIGQFGRHLLETPGRRIGTQELEQRLLGAAGERMHIHPRGDRKQDVPHMQRACPSTKRRRLAS